MSRRVAPGRPRRARGNMRCPRSGRPPSRVLGGTRDALHDVAVLGADTAVIVDGEILGKPRDDDDGAGMLKKLSGRAHEVLTGISLRTSAGEWGRVEETRVYMTELTAEDVAWYVAS